MHSRHLLSTKNSEKTPHQSCSFLPIKLCTIFCFIQLWYNNISRVYSPVIIAVAIGLIAPNEQHGPTFHQAAWELVLTMDRNNFKRISQRKEFKGMCNTYNQPWGNSLALILKFRINWARSVMFWYIQENTDLLVNNNNNNKKKITP